MLQPIGPRVLIRPDDPITKVGVIALPDNAQKPVTQGTVLAVGDPDGDYEMPLRRGDRVYYSQYGGHQIKLKDETLLVLSLKDVFLIVLEDKVESRNPYYQTPTSPFGEVGKVTAI